MESKQSTSFEKAEKRARASYEASERRMEHSRRRIVLSIVAGAFLIVGLYLIIGRIAGLQATLDRIEKGNVWWLILACLFRILALAGYMWLFRAIFVREDSRIGWGASYEITMAGVMATRLFAAGGAGGVALTVWALRKSGMNSRRVASGMIAFLVLLYGIYMLALVIDGSLLYLGVLPGPAPFAVTVVPAIFGAVVIAIFIGIAFIPTDIEARFKRSTQLHGRTRTVMQKLVVAPASLTAGIREALWIIRCCRNGTLGALAWWGFDILTLWASFKAFGNAPSMGIIVMAYFVGTLGNLLPLPGGLGGVDGGLIGAFLAFGVSGSLAVIAVFTYRAFSYWLPMIPGAIAYFQLRKTVHRWEAETARARTG